MQIKTMASASISEIVFPPNEMLVIWGISMAESAGSASTAEIVLRRGLDATGQELIAPINFAADGFGYPTFFPHPIRCEEGVFLERRSGSTTVVIYYDLE